jgi:hypothetical protein
MVEDHIRQRHVRIGGRIHRGVGDGGRSFHGRRLSGRLRGPDDGDGPEASGHGEQTARRFDLL